MSIDLLRKPRPSERRTPEQLWEQYQVEKALAAKLRAASRAERGAMYASVYEELFRRIPHHSQLTRKESPAEQAARIASQLSLLRPYLTKQTRFLEIGAGDCALSLALTSRVAHVYALDVSAEITRSRVVPPNFDLILSDGTSIDVPAGSITVAYSNQLMEHLHPDDALLQLSNIYQALAPGGVYICITPNRLTGPHDISLYFDSVATGFHLKEYTSSELIPLFRRVGFRSVHQYFRQRQTYLRMPSVLTRSLESVVEHLGPSMRRRVPENKLMRSLLTIRLVARK